MTTAGENAFSDALKQNMPAESKFWRNVEISGTSAGRPYQDEIDCVIADPSSGVYMAEVKDWRANQIETISYDCISVSGRIKGNPLKALQQKFYHLQDRLRRTPELIDTGKRLVFPINTFVCLPYVSHAEWGTVLQKVGAGIDHNDLPRDRLFLADDLGLDGASFHKCLKRKRTCVFPSRLSMAHYSAVEVAMGTISDDLPHFATLKDFAFGAELGKLIAAGGKSQKAGIWLRAHLQRLQPTDVAELLSLPSKDVDQVENGVVYHIDGGISMVTMHHAGIIYLLHVGRDSDAAAWLEQQRGLTLAIDNVTGRITPVRVDRKTLDPAPNICATAELLFAELDIDWSLSGLSKMEIRAFSVLPRSEDSVVVADMLADVADYPVHATLTGMIAELRTGNRDAADMLWKLWIQRAHKAATDAPSEAASHASGVNSDVLCGLADLSPAEFTSLMDGNCFNDWMVFLHPAQREIVERDDSRRMLITGVSGSGKTCIVVHRARRLARVNPESRVAIVTLSRALAEFIDQLVGQLCAESERRRIRVCAYYDLFAEILNRVGVQKYLEDYRAVIHEKHPMHQTLDRVDVCRCINDFDPRSGENPADSWEECLDQQTQQLRDATARLGSYFRECQWNLDIDSYMQDEITMVRTAIPLQQRREVYLSLPRVGRAIPLRSTPKRPHRQDVLHVMGRYEEYLLAGGLMDCAGLTQVLMSERERIKTLPSEMRFDHVLVDEYQDFSTQEIRLLESLATAKLNAFCVAGDTNQRVHAKLFEATKAGFVEGAACVYRIRRNYRNSRQILKAASLLSRYYGDLARKSGVDVEILDPELAERDTALPLVFRSPDQPRQIAQAWQLAREWIEGDKGPRWSVCIATAAPWAITVEQLLHMKPQDIAAGPVSGTYTRNDSEMVVGTIGDVKGFDFSMIVIVGCSDTEFPNPRMPEPEAWRDAMRLYVAMTRGRDQVALLYSGHPSHCLRVMESEINWANAQGLELDSAAQRNLQCTMPESDFSVALERARAPEGRCSLRTTPRWTGSIKARGRVRVSRHE